MSAEAAGEARFGVAAPEVVHQSIDGEAILVHLGTGAYYSLRGSGAVAFAALAGGASAPEVAAALAASYEVEAGVAEAAARALLADLRREGLVVELPRAASPGPAPGASAPALAGAASASPALAPAATSAPPSATPARRPFEPPRLEGFKDLQDLILADPIHDVEPTGWPHVAPPAPPP